MMRQQDITDPIDVINLKIGWYQRLAAYIIRVQDRRNLFSLVEAIHKKHLMATELAMKFLPVLREEHPVYSGVIGYFICKAMMERLDIYDDTFRLAPQKQEMGHIEEVGLFYHTDTREYEVSDGTIGVRFPALYVPVFGIDVADEETAAEMATAILSSRKKTTPPFSIVDRFPSLDVGHSLPPRKEIGKTSSDFGKNSPPLTCC